MSATNSLSTNSATNSASAFSATFPPLPTLAQIAQSDIATEINRLTNFINHNVLYTDLNPNDYGMFLELISRWTLRRGLFVNGPAQKSSFILLFKNHLWNLFYEGAPKTTVHKWIQIAMSLVQGHLQQHSLQYARLVEIERIEGPEAIKGLAQTWQWTDVPDAVISGPTLLRLFYSVMTAPKLEGEIHLGSHYVPQYLLTPLRLSPEFVQPGLCTRGELEALLGVPAFGLFLGITDCDNLAYYCGRKETVALILQASVLKREQGMEMSANAKAMVLKDVFIF